MTWRCVLATIVLGLGLVDPAVAQGGLLDDPPDAGRIRETPGKGEPKRRGMLDDEPDAPGKRETPAKKEPERRETPDVRREDARREKPPAEQLKIPRSLSELNGCWESESGEMGVFSEDNRKLKLGTRRDCYCFQK